MILWILKEVFSGGLLGMPPGERDPAMLRVAPPDAVAYVEWSSRLKGREGAKGAEGLLAEAEIRQFLTELDTFLGDLAGDGDVDAERPLFSKPGYEIIKSLGMRPGSAYLRIDAAAMEKGLAAEPAAGQLLRPALLDGIEGAILFQAGDDADAVASELVTILSSLSEDDDAPDLDHHELPTTLPHLKLTIHRHESYFILGLGEHAVDHVVEGLTKPRDGIASNPRFTAAMKAVAFDRAGSVGWVDVQQLFSGLKDGMGPQGLVLKTLADAVGLGSIQQVASSVGLVDGEICARTFVTTDGRTEGVMSIAGGRRIVPADFACIPADADIAVAASVSISKILAAVRDVSSKLDPAVQKVVDDAFKQWEDDSDIPLADITAAFGDVWTMHNASSQGGLLLSAGIVSLEVKDEAKARSVMDKLMTIFGQALAEASGDLEDAPHFAEQEFLGRRISYLSSAGNGWSVVPSVCLTDRRLYLALQPQALKSQLRFEASGRAGFETKLADAAALPEGDALFVSRIDAKAWVQTLSAFLPYWGQAAAEHFHFEGHFDVFAVPSIDSLLPYATPASTHVIRRKDGFLFESRGGLPVPGGMGLLLELYLWLRESPDDELFGVVVPSDVPLAFQAPATVTCSL